MAFWVVGSTNVMRLPESLALDPQNYRSCSDRGIRARVKRVYWFFHG
jgi:hypothetical protein